jgi:DNA polymerase (family 10)
MGLRRDAQQALDRCAFAAELLDEPSARAWGRASLALRQLDGDVAERLQAGTLGEVPGLGPKAIQVIADLGAGREPTSLTELKQRLPEGLFEIRRVRGLGPKKVATLWKDLDITSLAELEQACRENRLSELKGFGKKTQSSVLEQIPSLREERGRMRRDAAEALSEKVAAELVARGASDVLIGGDVRLGAELVDRLAVVAVADGTLDTSDLDERVTVLVSKRAHAGAALVIATGPEAFVASLREKAALETLDAPTEEALFAALGMDFVPPELRAEEPERKRPSKRLVQRSDLRGALHNHTNASDGSNTLEEMRAAAEAWGLSYFGISEHSVSAFYAGGLDADRLKAQLLSIEKLNRTPGCVLLTGVESDILESGGLDYPDALFVELARENRPLEVVVASVHKRHGHGRDAATARMTGAARSPWTTLLGHPTGRLLLGRAPMDFDVEALLDACAESGCAIELNANPQRLDLSARHAAMAKERGVLISIAADAHHVSELDNLEHGLAVARRAGLGPEDVLNCMELPQLRTWLDERRAKAIASV